MKNIIILFATILLFAVGSFAQTVIKIGTLASADSPWGQVLRVWARAVDQRSGGNLQLDIAWDSTAGDETQMVQKMKTGGLDAALLSDVGLGRVYKPIAALEMPGLFGSWAKLEAARNAMNSEFHQGAKDDGFSILGWTDIGAARFMSTNNMAIRTPEDIKGKKPCLIKDDLTQPALYEAIGGNTPVPVTEPSVSSKLGGECSIVYAGSLDAEQLGWASNVTDINSEASSYLIGAIVITAKRNEALSADQRAILEETGQVAANNLGTRIRTLDDQAFARLKGSKRVTDPSADDRSKWAAIFKQARERLARGVFAPELVTKLEGLGK